LANAVRNDASAPKAVPVAGGVLPKPGASSTAIGEFEIAASRDVLRAGAGNEQQRAEDGEE
ncbi:MAG TPA: hypothetical protein VK478_16985, partial [Gemmatimonadaceae bacterium]|nr:hypothetical protein [Gemmatimonadaceae bacterium]